MPCSPVHVSTNRGGRAGKSQAGAALGGAGTINQAIEDPMKAISLFSGAGGMDVGFRKAGFEVIWANDFDKAACKTYELNHGPHIHHGDLDELMPQLAALGKKGGIDCLFGGPPCQGFSVAGKMD